MTIGFNDIPTTLRVPFAYIEFDNSKAQQGPSIQPYKTLLIGTKIAAGTATVETPITVTSEAQARTLFGAGSVLFAMYKRYFQGDKVTPVTCIAQAPTGTAAVGKLSVAAGTATAAGEVALYIGGIRYGVSVAVGDIRTDVATAIVAAITAEAESYCTAVINGINAYEVDVTFKTLGEFGNDCDIRLNYLDSDSNVAGVGAITITPFATGATNPDIDDVIAVMPDDQFNVIVNSYMDATNRGKLEAEMDDRFGPIRQNEGLVFMAMTDSLANLTTLGNSENSKHFSIMGATGPSPYWEWAAAAGAQAAKSAQADPALPLQTLPLVNILPPQESEKFSLTERNALLYDGISTHRVVGGVVTIERLITTWQTNGAGAPDTSYLDVETLFTLSFLRYSFRNRILAKYARSKLANDGTRFGAGQKIITPLLGKAEAVALFAEWETAGLVEGADQFKRDLIVERNQSNPSRLDFLMPPDLVNQLRIIGCQIQFLI
jgi:phage tail sheath gpL-like